jgi:hypothetical protein
MEFPGPPESDEAARQDRLSGQLGAIFDLMADGVPRTLDEISVAVERDYGVRCPPASASAELRHLRKKHFGGHCVVRQHIGRGLYAYTLKVRRQQLSMF